MKHNSMLWGAQIELLDELERMMLDEPALTYHLLKYCARTCDEMIDGATETRSRDRLLSDLVHLFNCAARSCQSDSPDAPEKLPG